MTRIVCTILLAGCAAAPDDDRGGVGSVRQITQRHIGGARIVWLTGGAADEQVRREVDAMLANEIGPDEAVQVALLTHPTLQAEYERLGVAQADLVEAGLLRN